MAGLGNLVQKAFYLGVGLAAYVQENAEDQWQDLRLQAQKLAEEMVARGEMKAEEARNFVDEMVQQAQNKQAQAEQTNNNPSGPRQIEIIEDEEPDENGSSNVDSLRQQVETLQEELRNLQKK